MELSDDEGTEALSGFVQRAATPLTKDAATELAFRSGAPLTAKQRRNRAWRDANRPRVLAHGARYRDRHREQIRAKARTARTAEQLAQQGAMDARLRALHAQLGKNLLPVLRLCEIQRARELGLVR